MKTAATPVGRTSRRSSEAAGPARPCGCHSSSQQTRLRIGPHDDPLEREADRAADALMAGQPVAAVGGAPVAPQRKCASCEAEEPEPIRRSPAPSHGPTATVGQAATTRAAAAADAVALGGRPLEPALRQYFEPRFGADLSPVRIHTDSRAARAAADLHALAYTLGSSIAFAPGAFAPASPSGRRLIAHELTHIVQQRRGDSSIIRRDGEPGTSEYEEDVTTQPTLSGGMHRGRVRRRVFAPASDTKPREQISEATVPVEFDPAACSVRLPHTYSFVAGESSEAGICNDPPRPQAVPAVSAARLSQISTSYLRTINDALQGWYTVRLEGDTCESPCVGQDMPIRVAATTATGGAAADTPITVSARSGRADSGTICAGHFNTSTVIHEGGHQVLGADDEYPERDAAVLAESPEWGRPERVRTDWTRMGAHHSYGRFASFHERHFGHVPAFLRSVFPGCTARLIEVSRPVLPDFRLSAGAGYARVGGSDLPYFDVGLEMGIPFSRLRDWEFTVGPHGRYLGTANPREQEAFLLGARFGIEHTWHPAEGGVRVGGYGEVGGGAFKPPSELGEERPGFSAAPYGELGLSTGYRFGGTPAFDVGLEAGGGTTFTAVPGAEAFAGDPRTLQWMRLGLTLGGEF